MYYTPRLRPYSAKVLTVGQLSLDIPPGLKSVSFSGKCSAYCTSALPQPLYIATADLNMHLLGEFGSIYDTDFTILTQQLICSRLIDYIALKGYTSTAH